MTWYANPEPPVELFARGVDVEVAWHGGETITATGNSFAAPHISGICALIRAKHPTLAPAGREAPAHAAGRQHEGDR